MSGDWGSDVRVSMPEPNEREALVPMYGFVFTIDGLRHDLTEADHERLSRPGYAPVSPVGTEWGDEDLDA